MGRHAGLVERRYGARMHELASRRIVRWASDPRVDAGMLRRALEDVQAADRLTAPVSDALKMEYLLVLRELKELKSFPNEVPLPGGSGGVLDQFVPWSAKRDFQQFRFRATNETERSRRVVRFLFANWLAQVDKPAAERTPKTKIGDIYFYEFDRSVARAARDVSPATVDRAIDETILARWLFRRTERGPQIDESAFGAWEGDGFFAVNAGGDRCCWSSWPRSFIGGRKVERPATAGELLGGYLKELPEGISRDDTDSGAGVD